MKKGTHIILVLSLLALLVMVAILNIHQNIMYNDSSMTYSFIGGGVNERNEFAPKSAITTTYKNIKPYKSSANYSNNIASGFNVSLNNPAGTNIRNSGHNAFGPLGKSDLTNPSQNRISYSKGRNLNSSNESGSLAGGSLGYSNKAVRNSSEGNVGQGNTLSGRMLTDRSSSLAQASSFLSAPTYDGGPLIMDPGGDPNPAEMIPVGDGLGLLSLLALFYALWKFYLSKN